jgi:diguanylate cyclase (GGDEF)-like protein
MILNYLKCYVEELEKENFRANLLCDNLRRSRILAVVMIIFECILIVVDIISSILVADDRFHFNAYLAMYLLMAGINGIYLLIIKNASTGQNVSSDQLKKYEIILTIYITAIMSWSSIVSLMDQKLYGQVTVFMIIMTTSSVLYYMESKIIWIPYLSSILILVIGLPFFQPSSDILIGHYVNLSIFIATTYLASRIIFSNYVNDFNHKVLLSKTNNLLEQEIEENKDINNKLELANLQLKRVALIDELTGIPNRRGFRNYIDSFFKRQAECDTVISILMIDIDFFKQYNDKYGHDAGDDVLIKVANEISFIVKNVGGYFCRWGGEEFVYIQFNETMDMIQNTAQLIRQSVFEKKILHEYSNVSEYISISIGSSTVKITGKEDVGRVINLADQALYQAKDNGRNCVVIQNE